MDTSKKSSKIKLEKEVKKDLVVDGIVYRVGFYYKILAGEDEGNVFPLDEITFDLQEDDFFLNLGGGEHYVNSKYAKTRILEDMDGDPSDYIQCPNCETHFLKDTKIYR